MEVVNRIRNSSRSKRLLCIALAASAIAFWFRFPSFPTNETLEFGIAREYTGIAQAIEKTGQYVRPTAGGQYLPELIREPLYPYAIIAANKILGGYGRLIPLQQLIAVLTCIIWTLAAWWSLGLGWAIAFAILAFFNPVIFYYPALAYPFTFNFFFLTLAIFSVALLIFKKQARWSLCAGLFFGLACYERGSLALLPPAIAITLLLIPVGIPRRFVLLLLLTYGACLSPWLIRNASHQIYGMSGMSGMTLGYAYGGLVIAENDQPVLTKAYDPFDLRGTYIEYIRKIGSDGGTWAFLNDKMAAGVKLPILNQAISSYVKHAILARPQAALDVIRANFHYFPGRIITLRDHHEAAWPFYQNNVCTTEPTAGDYVILIGGLLGLVLMAFNREEILLLILPVLLYLVAVNTIITVFDPRYRNGVFDLIFIFSILYTVRFIFIYIVSEDWRLAKIKFIG